MLLHGVREVARDIECAVLSGAYARGAERFIDYWGGAGTWASMPAERQSPILRYMPKACLDFGALFAEPTPLQAYRRLRLPLLLMLGEHAPAPTRSIVHKLTAVMQPAEVVTLPRAGHMGPLTHADTVVTSIARHLRRVEPWGRTAASNGMRRAA